LVERDHLRFTSVTTGETVGYFYGTRWTETSLTILADSHCIDGGVVEAVHLVLDAHEGSPFRLTKCA